MIKVYNHYLQTTLPASSTTKVSSTMLSVGSWFCTSVEIAAAVFLFLGVGLRPPVSVTIHIFKWKIMRECILTGMTKINCVT